MLSFMASNELTGNQVKIRLQDLVDVDFSSLQDGHSLIFDGTAWNTGINGGLVILPNSLLLDHQIPLNCWTTIYDNYLQTISSIGVILKVVYESEVLNDCKIFIRPTDSEYNTDSSTLQFNLSEIYSLVRSTYVTLGTNQQFDIYIESSKQPNVSFYICGYF